jgi:hypothetical protein
LGRAVLLCTNAKGTEKLAPVVTASFAKPATQVAGRRKRRRSCRQRKNWRKLPFENDISDVIICDNDILRVLTFSTEDMEIKDAESDKEGEEHLCLHLEKQLLVLRLFDSTCAPSKHMMPAWFNFITYRGRCCSFDRHPQQS